MAAATFGIISIGDMGLGIAKLLIAHGFRVITNVSDRSPATQERARRNDIGEVGSDPELVDSTDYILSIVPPKEAIATARRIMQALAKGRERAEPLYYLDLNAISPSSARVIDELFAESAVDVRFIDGGIIGGPPSQKADDGIWCRPSIPVSGPYRLADAADPVGERVSRVLNIKHVNDTIGSATGLKMCFASLSKGFTALAIQSFTTAQQLGVVEELRAHLDEYSPGVRSRAEKGLVGMPPKAYRWVNEMEQIAETFEADGGFVEKESVFGAIAHVYELVADGTDLGKETTDDRQRGKSAEDVAKLMAEGTERRKLKTE